MKALSIPPLVFLFGLTICQAQTVLRPVITQQPRDVRVTETESAVLAVEVSASPPIQYQWRRNGVPIAGEVTATLRINASLADNGGAFDVVVTNPAGVATSTGAKITVLSSRLINISTRAFVGTGSQTMSVGFVVRGQSRFVLIRAVGPSLSAFGIDDYLPNPEIRLLISTGQTVAANDDWEAVAGPVLAGYAQSVGAFPLQTGSRDAALAMSLGPGNYTVEVKAREGGNTQSQSKTGIALVEVYEISP